MNRFRTKRKGKDKDDKESLPPTPTLSKAPTQESISSGPFKRFGKSKKSIEEIRPEIDLENALPKQDDFRTSLLMTGLSARFSMLREQDDPSTKIGKASDDSVLFPKRGSRGADFLFSGLGDISEVESIHTRPFARRDDYQSSEDGSDSIMNRGKPTEGNNLFGGRQKIYKISPSGNMGKALYEDDVSMSAFQRWRVQERERRLREDHDVGETTFSEDAARYAEITRTPPRKEPESPSSFARKKIPESFTASTLPSTTTTTSTDMSTLATTTSFASQQSLREKASESDMSTTSTSNSTATGTKASSSGGMSAVEKSVARTRRLYEQSLNQELQDHQNSSLSRMDTLARRFGPRTTEHPIGSMLIDRGVGPDRRLLAKSSAPNLQTRPISNSSATGPMDFLKIDGKQWSVAAAPLSPSIGEEGGEPRMFKTSQTYDELRYAQRQVQMKVGRDAAQNDNLSTRSRSESPLPGAVRRIPAPGRVPGKLDPNRLTFLEVEENEADRTRTPSLVSTTPSRRSFVDHSDHPALRDSTPSVGASSVSTSAAPAALSEQISSISETNTMAPSSAGLSGMVRAHLRSDSNVSSVYDDVSIHDSYSNTNALRSEPSNDDLGSKPPPRDEFANQLADRARIVREKLTSYAEGEGSRPASPSTRPDMMTKASKGSLREHKNMKIFGISSPMSAANSPSRLAFDEHETALPYGGEPRSLEADDDIHSMHPGLMAFRKARNEMARQMQNNESQSPNNSRNISRPPVSYNFRDGDNSRTSVDSRASSDYHRDRSNSDASNSSRSARPLMRSNNGYSNNGRVPPPPPPPPQGMYSSRTNSPVGRGLSINTQGRHMESSIPTPNSPMRLDDAVRRRVSKKEISEPTLQSSTSRVPTATLPEVQVRPTDLHIQTSSGSAPPLPPINPRRRNVLGGFTGRKEEDGMISPHFPPTPTTPGYSQGSQDSPADDMRMPGGMPGGMF